MSLQNFGQHLCAMNHPVVCQDCADRMTKSLRAIQTSSSEDYRTPLQWAQWCRDVARAALDKDDEWLKEEIE